MTRELSLQPRLALLASLVPQGAVLADVGTDHGYIPVCLRQRGVIDRAIASDIGREPLEHARRTAEEYGVGGIDLRLCAGLDAIAPEECDTVLIAGMGGETIWGILAAAPWTRDGRHTLLLQPQTKIEELRLRLCENGYAVTREHLVRDKGKLYVVMTVTAGERYSPGAEQLYGGLALEREALYGDYLAHQIARLRRRPRACGSRAAAKRTALPRWRTRWKQRKGSGNMTTAHDIERSLYDWAPRELAMAWDNVGLLVGDPAQEVRRVLVALDITQGVAEEAVSLGAQMIVSHHPVMNCAWHEVQTLRADDAQGRLLRYLVRHGLAACCMHTNLDAADGGVNDCLAHALGLSGLSMLNEEKIGRIGTLSCEIPLEEFLPAVVKSLRCSGLRFRDGGKPVHRVAVGGGACRDYIPQAIAQGCDTFVTADLRYNDFLDTHGLNLIDAGHYPTENVVCEAVRAYLARSFPLLEVVRSASHHDAIQYYL